MTAVHRLGIVYLGFTPRIYTELGDKRIYRLCREQVSWSLKSTNAVEQNSLLMRCFVSRRLHAGQREAERCNEKPLCTTLSWTLVSASAPAHELLCPQHECPLISYFSSQAPLPTLYSSPPTQCSPTSSSSPPSFSSPPPSACSPSSPANNPLRLDENADPHLPIS